MITRCFFAIMLLGMASLLLYADVVTYTYDDAGRLTAVNYPNGASITYTYDAAGNLTARTVTAAASSAKKPDPKVKDTPSDKARKQKSNEDRTVR